MCLPSTFEIQVYLQLFNLNSSKPFNPSFRKKDFNTDVLRERYNHAVIEILRFHGISIIDINKDFDKVWSIVRSIQKLRQKNKIPEWFKKSQREVFKEIWGSYKDKISPYISQRITEYEFEKSTIDNLGYKITKHPTCPHKPTQ
jgi:hypothetical protein